MTQLWPLVSNLNSPHTLRLSCLCNKNAWSKAYGEILPVIWLAAQFSTHAAICTTRRQRRSLIARWFFLLNLITINLKEKKTVFNKVIDCIYVIGQEVKTNLKLYPRQIFYKRSPLNHHAHKVDETADATSTLLPWKQGKKGQVPRACPWYLKKIYSTRNYLTGSPRCWAFDQRSYQ